MMRHRNVLKILIMAAVVVSIIAVLILNNTYSLSRTPVQIYVPWRDHNLNVFTEVVEDYSRSRGGANVTVIYPRSAQIDARALVFAKMIEEYIKPMIVRRDETPSIVFVTTCGRELASYIYASVWGGDDYVKLGRVLDKSGSKATLACSLTGFLRDLNQQINDVFAAPIMIYQANLIYVNRNLLDKLGVGIPKNLIELLNVCEIAAGNNITCIALPGYDPKAINAYDVGPVVLWENILLSVGGSTNFWRIYYGDISPDDEIVKRSIEVLSNMTKYIQSNWRRTTRDGAIDMLIKGEALMYVGGSWDIYSIKSRYQNVTLCTEESLSKTCDIIVAHFPGTSDVFSMVVYGVGVVNNPSSDAGIDFVKYLIKPETQLKLTLRLYSISPYLAENDYNDDVIKWLARNLKNSNTKVLSLAIGGMFSISGIDQTGAIYGIIQNTLDYIQRRTNRLDLTTHITTLSNYLRGHRDRWLSMNMVIGVDSLYLSEVIPSWFK